MIHLTLGGSAKCCFTSILLSLSLLISANAISQVTYYIPNDFAAPDLPMLLIPDGDPAPDLSLYVLADQTCAAQIAANDPFCVNTDWDEICQDGYNDCLYNAGCPNGQWYLPNNLNDGPIVFACSAPADYFLADQTCAQQVVNDDPFCVNNFWDNICSSAYNCCLGINGCTDFSACNYDPALCPDNTLCVYPGCNDATACNFDPAAGCDDGSCTYPQYFIPVDFSTSTNEPMILVCAGNEPANYVLADQGCAQAQVDNDPFCLDIDWDELCVEVYNCCAGAAPGCTDEFACNFDPNACQDNTLCVYPGCTDPAACNFDASAGCDDGSCVLPDGC
ncbi:MAG: hypothetical protein P8H59_01290, partial [Flavobacteriales bacterium]|nr:hypothetical protein [Flavobacteriales bacterium]